LNTIALDDLARIIVSPFASPIAYRWNGSDWNRLGSNSDPSVKIALVIVQPKTNRIFATLQSNTSVVSYDELNDKWVWLFFAPHMDCFGFVRGGIYAAGYYQITIWNEENDSSFTIETENIFIGEVQTDFRNGDLIIAGTSKFYRMSWSIESGYSSQVGFKFQMIQLSHILEQWFLIKMMEEFISDLLEFFGFGIQ